MKKFFVRLRKIFQRGKAWGIFAGRGRIVEGERVMKRIFVSHHHLDACELKKLKDQIAYYDVELFLAHEDLQPGSKWNKVLKKELRNCDAVLHIGNDNSRKSDYCDQELGFALALEKDIISVLTDKSIVSPWGFIADRHATKCNGVEDLRFHILKDKFFSSIVKENRRKHGKILGTEGFCLANNYISNYITLIPYDWNDFHYYTSFLVLVNSTEVAKVKIGYSGQTAENHTMNMLLGYFTHLGENMFSTIKYHDNLSLDGEVKNLINLNLNCLAIIDINHGVVNHRICDKALHEKFKDQGVVMVSLLRSDIW